MQNRMMSPIATTAISSLLLITMVLSGCAMSRKEKFQHDLTLAQQGDLAAQVRVAEVYAGRFDFVHAKPWLEKAASRGSARADRILSDIYYQGLGEPKDMAKSLYWLEKAGNDGDVSSMYTLGYGYLMGKDVPYDMKKAITWFDKAAAQHDGEANYTLGLLYSGQAGAYTQDLPEDMAKARQYFKASSEAGYDKAPVFYALMAETGQGGEVDKAEAYVWFVKAGTMGDRKAAEHLKELQDNMTIKELREGQQRLAKQMASYIEHIVRPSHRH